MKYYYISEDEIKKLLEMNVDVEADEILEKVLNNNIVNINAENIDKLY